MIEFDEWIQKTVPKWSEYVIKLGATWDTFKPKPNQQQEVVVVVDNKTQTKSKKPATSSSSNSSSNSSSDDVLLSDLVNGGIPLLVSRDIVSKAREYIYRTTSIPLTVYWDLDTISLAPAPATTSSVATIVTRVQNLLSSYGQSINFRGYSRTLSSILTEEQKYQLSSQYKFVFVDSSETSSCGIEVSMKRIIIDALKSDTASAVSSLSLNGTTTTTNVSNASAISSSSSSSLLSMCFITADVDITYLLSSLDRPQVFKVLITNSDPLLQQVSNKDTMCNVKLRWDNDVVCHPTNTSNNNSKKNIVPATTTSNGNSSTSRGVITSEKKTVTSYAAAVARAVAPTTTTSSSTIAAPTTATTSAPPTTATTPAPTTTKTTSKSNGKSTKADTSTAATTTPAPASSEVVTKKKNIDTSGSTTPTPPPTTATAAATTVSQPQDKQQPPNTSDKNHTQQLSTKDRQLLSEQIIAAALDLGDGQKHSALKSRIGSLLRLAEPSRFPTRDDLTLFLTQAVEDNICIETGYGEYKILTLLYNSNDTSSNGSAGAATTTTATKNTPPIEITKRSLPLSNDDIPDDIVKVGETSRPYVIFVPWSDCVNREIFPPKASVHTTEKWAMLMFETLIAAQQAAVVFPWIRQSGDYLIDFRRRNNSNNNNNSNYYSTTTNTTAPTPAGKENKMSRKTNEGEVDTNSKNHEREVEEGEIRDEEALVESGNEAEEQEAVVVRKPRYNNNNNNTYELTDEQQIRAVVNVMEMLLKSDELYVSEPVLKYQLAARRGGDGNDNKQYYYWIEKAVTAGSILLFRRPGVPKGRFYCLTYQLDNSRAACAPNEIDTCEEEKHVVDILINTPSDRWVTRKSIIESLQLNFDRMKSSPALRVRVFQNAARKELFFVAKDGSTQVVATTKDEAYEYLKKAVAKRDAYNAAHHPHYHPNSTKNNNSSHQYHTYNSNNNNTNYGKKYANGPYRSNFNNYHNNNYRTTFTSRTEEIPHTETD